MPTRRELRTAIIGAGPAGIAAGRELRLYLDPFLQVQRLEYAKDDEGCQGTSSLLTALAKRKIGLHLTHRSHWL